MRGQVGRWGVPLVLGVGTAALGGGCGLVLNYGDLGGTGGASASAASASTASANGGASTSASAGGGGSGGVATGTSSTSSAPSGSMASGSSTSSSTGGKTCSGSCQATIPGWTPVLYYKGLAAPPQCPEGPVLFDGGTGPTGSSAVCTACACGTPVCDGPFKLDVWAIDKTCVGTPTSSTTFAPTDCVTLPATVASIVIEKPAGSSPASGGMATFPPATWGVHDETCTPAIETCGAGQTCLEKAPSGFETCLSSAPGSGPVACPITGYLQNVFATSFDDTRGCTSCTCGCDACSGDLFAYQTACPGIAATGPEPFITCVSGVPSSTQFLKVDEQPMPPASCMPSVAGSTGTLTAGASVVTVCCP